MQIKKISVYQFDYTLPKSYKLSGGRIFHTTDTTIIEMETDEGITGLGEACPFSVYYGSAHALGVRAGVAELAPRIIGMDPRETDRINDLMDAVLPGLNYVKAGIDTACWDILGKATGLPVYALMGGHNKKDLPLISSVPTGSPDEMVASVQRYRSKGLKIHSIKVGGPDPSEDAERVLAVLSERQSGEFFMLDANRSWTLETALRFVALTGPLDAWIEAPCRSYAECLAFKRRTEIPVSIDEHMTGVDIMLQVLRDEAADVVNIKAGKTGGLSKCRRIRDLCQDAGIVLSIQETGGGDIAFSALLHLAQSGAAHIVHNVFDPRDLNKESTASGAPQAENGYVQASDSPGLGVELLRDVVGKPVAVYEHPH